jgi:hypothetical protein
MRFNTFLPLATVVTIGIIVGTFNSCTTGNKRVTSAKRLPESCSLLAMSPKDRVTHQKRLDNLREAARLLRETSRGFSFTVDLHLMPANELQMWMDNEQKCCSFLQITNRVFDGNSLAIVTVDCPSTMRMEVMSAFGLRANYKTR